MGHQRKLEAYARASRLRKLPLLSEWRCEYSADGFWKRGVECLGGDCESVDPLRGYRDTLYTHHRLIAQSTHRVATTAFWRTFHHDGKISPAWCGWGGGVHDHPLSLQLPSRTKLQLRFSRAGINTPTISSTSMYVCTLWLVVSPTTTKDKIRHQNQRIYPEGLKTSPNYSTYGTHFFCAFLSDPLCQFI